MSKSWKTRLSRDGSTFLLKAAVVGFGLLALAACIFLLPYGIATDQTGYYRPILIGMYVPAIPFFYGVYQVLKLLGYIEKNQAFTEKSVDALKKIKFSGLTISAMYVAGMPFIFNAGDRDDAPGVILAGLILVAAPLVVGVAAGTFQRLVQNAVDLKAENDLTV